jgi:hypothetical protein
MMQLDDATRGGAHGRPGRPAEAIRGWYLGPSQLAATAIVPLVTQSRTSGDVVPRRKPAAVCGTPASCIPYAPHKERAAFDVNRLTSCIGRQRLPGASSTRTHFYHPKLPDLERTFRVSYWWLWHIRGRASRTNPAIFLSSDRDVAQPVAQGVGSRGRQQNNAEFPHHSAPFIPRRTRGRV